MTAVAESHTHTQIEKRRRLLIGVMLIASALMIGLAVTSGAKAADKNAPKPAAAAPAAETVPSWTGLGFDVHGALATGTADWGAPVNVGIDGQTAGGAVFYNHKFGALVLGIDAGYDRVWGDLHAFGIDYALTVGVRAGLLATDRTLVYTRCEWLRAQGGGSHADGIGCGAGIEARLPHGPASIALEYMHDWMDKDAFGPGVDVSADRITTRLKFNLDRDVTKIFADR